MRVICFLVEQAIDFRGLSSQRLLPPVNIRSAASTSAAAEMSRTLAGLHHSRCGARTVAPHCCDALLRAVSTLLSTLAAEPH